MGEDEKKAEIFKVGSLNFKIYQTTAGTWRGYIRLGGKPWVGHRSTREAAEDACREYSKRINEGVVTTHYPLQEAQDIAEALRTIAPFGVSLTDATRYYAQQHRGLKDKINVKKAVDEFIEQKTADHYSADYVQHSKVYLNKLSARFGARALIELDSYSLDSWLRNLKCAARSRNNTRNMIITFSRWAQKIGYLPKGEPTAAENTQIAKEDEIEISVISPETFSKMLKATSKNVDALYFLMFGAHTGIRVAELARLEWSDVDLESGYIEIAAHKAKTAARRLVPINATLKAWLQSKGEKKGPILAYKRIDLQVTPLVESVIKKWPRNCLRHSYISYRVAEIQNTNQVALEAGNSPQKIFSNYRNVKLPDGRLMTKELAAKWFAVTP